MICPRHKLIARFEHNLCKRCFTEARDKAEDVALEAKLAAMRMTSATELIRRLEGRR